MPTLRRLSAWSMAIQQAWELYWLTDSKGIHSSTCYWAKMLNFACKEWYRSERVTVLLWITVISPIIFITYNWSGVSLFPHPWPHTSNSPVLGGRRCFYWCYYALLRYADQIQFWSMWQYCYHFICRRKYLFRYSKDVFRYGTKLKYQ